VLDVVGKTSSVEVGNAGPPDARDMPIIVGSRIILDLGSVRTRRNDPDLMAGGFQQPGRIEHAKCGGGDVRGEVLSDDKDLHIAFTITWRTTLHGLA